MNNTTKRGVSIYSDQKVLKIQLIKAINLLVLGNFIYHDSHKNIRVKDL
jgi:hypothetical protein